MAHPSHSGHTAPAGLRLLLAGVFACASALAIWDASSWDAAPVEFSQIEGGLASDGLAAAEQVVVGEVGSAYPGAAVAFGIRERIERIAGFGRTSWSASSATASPDATVYDLASLTKAVATTTAVLLLAEDGRIDLDDPVQRTLPEFEGRWKEDVTWRHLLTHTSGLPAGTRINGDTPEEREQRLLRTLLRNRPGDVVQYSDIGFIILWAAAERAAGEPLEDLLERRVWTPLGMTSTRFAPGEECEACAPTLTLKSGALFAGLPSDPSARLLGGTTGNAGLFSTASDMARYVAMIASGGEWNGVRILKRSSIRELLRQQPNSGRRTLGWTSFCPEEPSGQHRVCENPVAFGHTGWSGTSFWVDPVTGVWAVVLTNRTLGRPDSPPPLDDLRRDVFRRVADSKIGAPLPDTAPSHGRLAD